LLCSNTALLLVLGPCHRTNNQGQNDPTALHNVSMRMAVERQVLAAAAHGCTAAAGCKPLFGGSSVK
jgi:hypothetical protein